MDLNNLGRGDLHNLQNQETDFDQAAMWKNINPEKKKRRPFLWLWLAGSLGMALLLAGIFFNDPVKNNSTPIITISENKASATLPENENLNPDEKINSKRQTVELNNNKAISKNKTNAIENKNTSPEYMDTSTSTMVQAEQPEEKMVRGKKTFAVPDQYLTKTKQTIPTKKSSEIIFRKGDQKTQTLRLATLPKIPQKLLKYPTNTLKPARIPVEREVVNTSELEAELSEESPVIPNKTPRFTLSTFAGIGYQFRTLQSKSEAGNPTLLNTRNSSETILESIVFGFTADRNIGKKWTVGLGLEMIRHREKMILQNRRIDNLASLDREEIPDQYRGNNGFLIRFQDSVFYNQHRLVNLPIRFGYRLQYKNIRLFPELEMVLNLSQKSSGHILTRFGTSEKINRFFSNQFGLSYRIGCKVLIPTGRKFMFYVRPNFEWNPNDVSSTENLFSQRRNVMRLDLGISRTF